MRPTACLLLAAVAAAAAAEPTYVRKSSRGETAVATLKAAGLPTLEGDWHVIGPFANADGAGFAAAYPPEREADLTKTYPGKGGKTAAWKRLDGFRPGKVVDLRVFGGDSSDSVCYLYHEFDAPAEMSLPLSLGSDDGIVVWHNGAKVLENDATRPAAPDQEQVTLKLRPGRQRLLIKVTNGGGEWAVYVAPELPDALPAVVRKQFERDFPPTGAAGGGSVVSAEAKHYRIETIPVPEGIVLEVGGLGFRPDGKLLACTRRGEVWLVSGLESDPANVRFTKFASGLHEALGLTVEDDRSVYVVQRPELTKLVDGDGDGVADEYVTVCDKWGVSGDYHEFAFGPARDKDGNFFVTLNVGFGGGHQAKAPWRGWCVKVTPKGEMTPVATGLRSPNGVAFSPEGDLFYADNQGEWVATNKLHHIRRGEFYGHQAGLRWLKDSPFAATLPEKVAHGMLYDGQKGKGGGSGMPALTPPVVWFPYGKMGQSASEPRWDTTGGRFGPFAGQCFVGDQTKSCVMRVALEKVNGRYQGACVPFRSGFQCGVNRLAFGPDHALYAGQTNRGWGSVGPKPYGLQRLVYTGVEPFEIHSVKVTAAGFDLRFTKPIDPAEAKKAGAFGVESYTYNYFPTYGSPEEDRRAEKAELVGVSADGLTASLAVPGLRRGRVYELTTPGVASAAGEPVLHPEAWYTLNELP